VRSHGSAQGGKFDQTRSSILAHEGRVELMDWYFILGRSYWPTLSGQLSRRFTAERRAPSFCAKKDGERAGDG
jgi:hypothetical protein